VAAGLGHLSPEELDKMLDDEGMSDFFARPGIQHTRVMATSKVRHVCRWQALAYADFVV
jgi:hypothetical protein